MFDSYIYGDLNTMTPMIMVYRPEDRRPHRAGFCVNGKELEKATVHKTGSHRVLKAYDRNEGFHYMVFNEKTGQLKMMHHYPGAPLESNIFHENNMIGIITFTQVANVADVLIYDTDTEKYYEQRFFYKPNCPAIYTHIRRKVLEVMTEVDPERIKLFLHNFAIDINGELVLTPGRRIAEVYHSLSQGRTYGDR